MPGGVAAPWGAGGEAGVDVRGGRRHGNGSGVRSCRSRPATLTLLAARSSWPVV